MTERKPYTCGWLIYVDARHSDELRLCNEPATHTAGQCEGDYYVCEKHKCKRCSQPIEDNDE